jgi:hypothetical protein
MAFSKARRTVARFFAEKGGSSQHATTNGFAGAAFFFIGILLFGSRLVKPMRKLYKAKDDRAKLVFSPVAPFGAQIPAVAAAVLSGYGSH